MRLLMVGQLNGQLATASKMAAAAGAKVSHAPDEQTGLDLLRGRGADLIMIDVKLNIAHFIEQLRSERFALDVIACGIGTDARAAVEAIRAGAKEYVPLPPEADLIAAVIQAVADDSHPFIFRDPAMSRLVSLIDQVAPSEASILITGESGTGKEVIARYIHKKSNRSDKPFIAVNCAAIPENLLESELFGHERGAFTGAVARRVGKFEEADGGTLLLDEISEMDIRLQAKLLRAIQERQIDRVGGAKPTPVNIRIVATSNRNLAEEVKKGTFREDLMFRLNVLNVRVPSLRDRPADVKVLADHFAKKYAELNGFPYRAVDESALKALLSHSWQGNVRELENTLHRAVLLASGSTIGSSAIVLPDGTSPTQSHHTTAPPVHTYNSVQAEPTTAENASSPSLVGRTVADVERDLIIDTLKHCLGNRTHAANILGISIRTLRNKLNEYQETGVVVPPPGLGDKIAV
jgi:DNA-binding NtrC family response regulator